MARAMVKPTIVRAPASRNARAHASSVAPVVITSSSNKTRKLSTRPPSRIAKAPRTASERSSLRSKCFRGRGLARVRRTGRYGSFKSRANGCPIQSARTSAKEWGAPERLHRGRSYGRSEMQTFAAGKSGQNARPWVISLAKFPGAPHSSQASPGKRSNEERQSSQRGKRPASGRN
jgi:hypothetical protein